MTTKGASSWLEKDFLIDTAVLADESEYYSHYARLLTSNGDPLAPWKNGLDLQLKRLEDSKIEYKGKRILVISGGPGILAKKLAEFSEVVVTEYSPETVNQMKTELGLNVVKFDYKTDRIEDVVEGKFDFIYIESSINFCEDQEGFIEGLVKILKDNSMVLVNNDTATLGYMLTWQFADYIPTRFVHNEAFLKFFFQNGDFQLEDRFDTKYNAYWYRINIGGWKNKVCYLFRTPFWILYAAAALLPWKNLNRKWWSNNHYSVLRFHLPKKIDS